MGRFVLIVIAAFAAFAAYATLGPGRKPATPEEAAFREADRMIVSHKDRVGFGNTAEATAVAERFAAAMKTQQALFFTGGKKGGVSLSDGEFLTYCRMSGPDTCFLVHVPQLKRYKDEVRTALARIAWTTARSALGDRAGRGEVMVGLRGSALYGVVITGSENAPQITMGTSVPTQPLHSFFAESPQATKAPASAAP